MRGHRRRCYDVRGAVYAALGYDVRTTARRKRSSTNLTPQARAALDEIAGATGHTLSEVHSDALMLLRWYYELRAQKGRFEAVSASGERMVVRIL